MKNQGLSELRHADGDPRLVPSGMPQNPAWVSEVIKKIDAVGCFKRGWDSHDGLPLSDAAKRATLKFLDCFKHLDLPVPAVVLGSSGTLHLEWRSDGKALELDLGEGAAIDYVKVDSQGKIEEGQEIVANQDRLCALLEGLRNS